MIKTGTYAALIKGVSQQTPQEREDGQLSVQTNMLSDIVNGLRRRSGTKVQAVLDVTPDSYFNVLQLNSEYYIQSVTKAGVLSIHKLSTGELLYTSTIPYLAHTNKASIRTTVTRNQSYLLNTDNVPTKVFEPTESNPIVPLDGRGKTWVYFQSGSTVFGNGWGFTISHPVFGTITHTITGNYTYTALLYELQNRLNADGTIRDHYDIAVTGTVLSLSSKIPTTEDVNITAVEYETAPMYNTIKLVTCPVDRVLDSQGDLPNNLPANFDKYLLNVGTAEFLYNSTRNVWEVYKDTINDLDPKQAGWFKIMTGAFSKQYSVSITQGSGTALTYSVTTNPSDASQATAEYVITQLVAAMTADTAFTSKYITDVDGQVVSILSNTAEDQLVVTNTGGDTYITSSNASNTANRNLLPALLPNSLDGYIMSVGTGDNLAYYRYNHSTRNWAEVGSFEPRYTIQNTPIFWYFDYGLETVVLDSLDIQGRSAGNESNNPEPKFMNFGFTGISAYQSRLVLLSGAYVNFSKSSDPSVFMRTTVTELLDDDPIEVSATSLSNAQFEYAIPYNKDLIVIAQNQQAVIPNSSTVLTPKTAAIYPTTNTDISLACQPTVIARSLYYVYQRDLDYYQVGEFLPSPYTDSQYTTQSTTDHLPLYAESVCNCMSGSTASNVACFTSDTDEVLINQFYWRGDERPLMSYHKWVLPRNVILNAQVSSSMLFLVADDTKTVVINTDIQLNQLQTKPIPYLDLYQYVTITDGVGVKPTYLPDGDLVAVIYDNVNNRHSEVAYSIEGDQVLCKYNGVIAIGLRYMSEFTLTPPYLRDGNGNVVAGSKTTLQSLNFTTRGTGKFSYSAVDAYGGIEDSETSGATWSEVDLGYTWIGSVSNNIVTCRSKLNSTRVTLRTNSTTDLNITMTEYNLRIPDREVKRRR